MALGGDHMEIMFFVVFWDDHLETMCFVVFRMAESWFLLVFEARGGLLGSITPYLP